MKNRFRILFLLLGLFAAVAAPGQIWACGSEGDSHAAKRQRQENNSKPCCHTAETAPSSDAAQPDANGCHHPGTCPCDHDRGGCHCPGCGTASSGGTAFAAETTSPNVSAVFSPVVRKAAFYFSEHLPEAVCLPIWQPPRLVHRNAVPKRV